MTQKPKNPQPYAVMRSADDVSRQALSQKPAAICNTVVATKNDNGGRVCRKPIYPT